MITDIQITENAADPNNNFGWNSFKQPRVSGLCTLVAGASCVPITVLEPSSLSLIGAGVIAARWLRRRRKS